MGQPLAVLLVDDSRVVRSLGGAAIARSGRTVLSASDGAVGLRMFRAHFGRVSAVILDVQMPVMGGEELFGHLRLISPTTPVIVSTSRTVEEIGWSRLADGYIQKPWTARAILLELIRVGA